MKEIILPFSIGQVVYFKTDNEQLKFTVTAITIRPTGMMIEIGRNEEYFHVYDFELTANENTLIKLGIQS